MLASVGAVEWLAVDVGSTTAAAAIEPWPHADEATRRDAGSWQEVGFPTRDDASVGPSHRASVRSAVDG